MKRSMACLSFALLALSYAPSTAAERWVVYKDATGAWGYDTAKLVRDPVKATIEVASGSFYATPDTMNGKSYYFTTADETFDCVVRTVRVNKVVFYDLDFKIVETLQPGEKIGWKLIDDPTTSDVVDRTLFAVGCEGKTPPSGAIPAGDLKAALAKMKAPS